ncbi:VOC family protein [Kineococcus sp. R86509]|uniref:VOC family protein n=1 Tax=Kineococcus sp. R86509 TaxID=3093851 RepID=UPI0036D3DE75
MASRLTPYITFPGTAREALTFYRSVLGGELTTTTFGEFGGGEGVDPEGVMHGMVDGPAGFALMASDAPPGRPVEVGNNVTISLFGDDVEELRGFFAGLAEGGTVTTPLEEQVWGDEYGSFTDRFGINWLVNITLPTD